LAGVGGAGQGKARQGKARHGFLVVDFASLAMVVI
jgi:hypothetical protein